MSPFCESAAKRQPHPLTEIPVSNTAPPLPETTLHALTSLTSLFYKSHAWPRVCAVPSFPGQPGGLRLPLNFAAGRETFLVSFLCEWHFS
jgi:hypothetical protein